MQVFGNFVEARTLHSTHCRVGDKEFVLVFVDQVAIDFAGELRVVGSLRELATRDGAFDLPKIVL